MASPANASNGNRRRIFSGMTHVVKFALHGARVAAAAGTDSSIRPIKHLVKRARRKVTVGSPHSKIF
jgi:hypothetical protein